MSHTPRPESERRPSRPWRRRCGPIAAAAALAVGGGIALGVVLTGGSGPSPPGLRPAPPTSVPRPEVRVPSHNPRQSPPWGFTGSGWRDLCYGPVATPGARKQQPANDTQPCRPQSRRITGIDQIALTARAGADIDRLEAAWATIEPLAPGEAAARGVPRFHWTALDRRYRAMLRVGIRPVVVAYGTPGWAQTPDRPGTCDFPGGCIYPPTTRYIPRWREFVRKVMARFPKMAAFEVWNEPNYAQFFAPHAEPRLYARLLRAADQAGREAGFRRPIITGGLAPVPPTSGKMPPAKFLSRVYELAGKQAFDGIGAHPYPSRPPWTRNMAANLDQLRAVSARFGDGSKPLWITEVGLGGTRNGTGHFNVSLGHQGRALARMYRATQRRNIRSFLIYTLYDSGVPSTRFGTYGVLTPALRPKPAYCYLARHVGRMRACNRAKP